MRVVILTGLYPPQGGGAERATELLARGLAALGHEVQVVTTARAAGPSNEKGVLINRLRPRNTWIGDVFAQPFLTRARWNARELVDRAQTADTMAAIHAFRPDLIISANIKGLGGMLPRALAALPQPHVHIAHDFEPVEPMLLGVHDAPTRIRNHIWAALSRWRWGNPDLVLFPSAWLQKLLAAHRIFSDSRQAVLPNAVDVSGVGAGLASAQSGRPQGSPLRLLFLGQLEPHKGALWAARVLHEAGAGAWTLDVVGAGGDRPALEALATADARIRVHGPLTGAALDERWQHTDALIVPSRCLENAPLVIFEAAARRVPVIAADVGGIPEFVLPEENGWRFAAEDARAFVFAVQTASRPAARAALRWQRLPRLLAPEAYARELLALLPQAPQEVRLLCPSCRRPLVGGNCLSCNRSHVRDGVLVLHPPGMSAFKADEAAYHDRVTDDAAEIHQLDALRNRIPHERIFRHLHPVAPGGWVLELAAGSGEDGARAMRLGLKLIDTDIAPGAVAHAAAVLADEPDASRRLLAAAVDAERVPLPDASVAGAFMTASFHHAEDPRVVLAEMRRVLVPGARFVAAVEPHRLYFGVINILKPLLEIVLGKRTDKSVADEEHSGFWRSELVSLFIASGFSDVRIEPVWFTTGFLHYALEFGTRLLRKKKRLRVPEAVERIFLGCDRFVFALPGGQYLAWHWTASGRKD